MAAEYNHRLLCGYAGLYDICESEVVKHDKRIDEISAVVRGIEQGIAPGTAADKKTMDRISFEYDKLRQAFIERKKALIDLEACDLASAMFDAASKIIAGDKIDVPIEQIIKMIYAYMTAKPFTLAAELIPEKDAKGTLSYKYHGMNLSLSEIDPFLSKRCEQCFEITKGYESALKICADLTKIIPKDKKKMGTR